MTKFEGVYSVLPTPFRSDSEVDVRSLKQVVELFIEAGVNGLTALGVTGEVDRISDRERMLVVEAVMDQVSRRVPVVVGTTAGGTSTCVEYSRAAQNLGAAAVMVSPPRMAKLNSEAILRHYRAVADQVGIPIVVQDYPPISGFTMEASLLVRIAREVPQARTIKLEDPPTPLKITRILEQAEGMDVKIFGGLGGVFLFEELLAGASGAMTGFAFPEILVEVVRQFSQGQSDQAADTFYQYVPLMRFEFQEGIGMAIRKEILRRRGVLESSFVRPPGQQIDALTLKALEKLFAWYQERGKLKWISV